MVKVLDWLGDKLRTHGLKKCILFFVAVAASLSAIIILWSLEKDVKVAPYVEATTTLSNSREISVIRRTKLNDGYSLSSISKDLISGISSKAEVISVFDEVISAGDNVRTKKEKMIIPKGAGYTEFAGIGIYNWKRTGKHFLTGTEFSEIHAVYLYEGQYIKASLMANMGFNADIQTGTY